MKEKEVVEENEEGRRGLVKVVTYILTYILPDRQTQYSLKTENTLPARGGMVQYVREN